MGSRRPTQGIPAAAAPVKTRANVQAKVQAVAPWSETEGEPSEEALRQSQARLAAVLETAVDAIITIDERGLMQSVNAATTRMFGYSAEEMLGRNVSMLMPSPYQEEHDAYIARYLQTGEKRIIGIGREVQALKRDGTVFPVDLAVSEVEAGKLFTGIIRDISERRLAEMRLRETDRMASIGALAAGLGHDMNNVLLPVRAHLNALKESADRRGGDREHLERIGKGVAYLQQLADGLHFLAMDPDRIEDVEGATDLAAWWAQTGPLLSKAVPRHVKVIVTFPPGLPLVAVAAHSLTQAVLNLIVNAGEAIPGPPQRKRRQGYVRVWVKFQPGDTELRLGVTDNGTGMTDEVRRRAFDMFFTTKARGLGTGLGLALVRKVVERAGGTVEIESEPGQGTTVLMSLPIVQAPAASSITAVVSIRDGRAASLVRNLLEAAGASVENGREPGRADIWITELSQESSGALSSWRKRCPTGQLVLVGPLRNGRRQSGPFQDPMQGPGQGPVHAITIAEPDDFEAVRSAISLALSRSKETA
jgi:PAS domain S-box-containing protein